MCSAELSRSQQCLVKKGDAVCTLGTVFSVKHEWILNHLLRNDFLVELDNRMIKTSPYESHTGYPAPRSTSLLNRILFGRRDDDDKQPRLVPWFDWRPR